MFTKPSPDKVWVCILLRDCSFNSPVGLETANKMVVVEDELKDLAGQWGAQPAGSSPGAL